MTDYDWDAIDHYSRGWAAGYRAACERVEGPTEPLEAFELSVDEGPTRPMVPWVGGSRSA